MPNQTCPPNLNLPTSANGLMVRFKDRDRDLFIFDIECKFTHPTWNDWILTGVISNLTWDDSILTSDGSILTWDVSIITQDREGLLLTQNYSILTKNCSIWTWDDSMLNAQSWLKMIQYWLYILFFMIERWLVQLDKWRLNIYYGCISSSN